MKNNGFQGKFIERYSNFFLKFNRKYFEYFTGRFNNIFHLSSSFDQIQTQITDFNLHIKDSKLKLDI